MRILFILVVLLAVLGCKGGSRAESSGGPGPSGRGSGQDPDRDSEQDSDAARTILKKDSLRAVHRRLVELSREPRSRTDTEPAKLWILAGYRLGQALKGEAERTSSPQLYEQFFGPVGDQLFGLLCELLHGPDGRVLQTIDEDYVLRQLQIEFRKLRGK